LGESIKRALIESEYLIVICSPRTKESKWVKEEINTFIKLGRSDKILTLIIEGSIEETIPTELIDINKIPLAADIRDENEKLSLKRLKDAKLKLIAPIIGCDYDDLVQRQAKEDKKFLWIFSLVSLLLASVFVILAISLKHTNSTLEQRNKELNHIFETSAIYVQFLLPIQDDYKKWSRATGKLLDIMETKDVKRAIRANELLAKYISLKGYRLKKAIDVLPFYENPQYFLKTLFFRNSKYTTGYIEDRYLSLFLLDSVEFPAKLFLFLAKPPIKLPKIYQRMKSAIRPDLERFGYFYKAIDYESKNRHQLALKFLDKAAKKGFFHSLTGNMSIFYLDTNYFFLYNINPKKLLKDVNSSNRLMTKEELQNLIKHINLYYLLSIAYAKTEQNYIKTTYSTDDEVLLWQMVQEENYGRISYKNFVDYLSKNLKVSNNKELEEFLYKLKNPKLSKEEIKKKEEYLKAQKKLNNQFKQEIIEALENQPNKSEKVESLINKIVKADNKKFTNRFLDYLFLQTKDIREIDKLLESLSKKAILKIKQDLSIPNNINTPKEIRIYIAKKIRAYSFDLAMYNRFVSNDIVFKNLQLLHKKEPNNTHIRFALRRYWQLKKDFKKADSYLSKDMKKSYFKDIEELFRGNK